MSTAQPTSIKRRSKKLLEKKIIAVLWGKKTKEVKRTAQLTKKG